MRKSKDSEAIIKKSRSNTFAELATIVILVFVAFFGPYFFLGFNQYDLSAFSLDGEDDWIAVLCKTQLIGETGWCWFNDRLGAPAGSNELSFGANVLMNFECLLTLIIWQFTHNAFSTATIQYLLVFPMAAAIMYGVLRSMGITRPISFGGGLTFGWLPFIFARYFHFSLACCYFVPLSAMLCIWAYRDDNLFNPKVGIIAYRRNWIVVFFALLIANNGISYYPFLACLFLCIVMLCRILETRDIWSLRPAFGCIVAIVFFFGLALAPSILWGEGSGTSRPWPNGELYGLKIIQMFIPLDGDGIELLQDYIDKYNGQMPLVNENKTAYLGIFGALGFLASLLYLFWRPTSNFVPSRNNSLAHTSFTAETHAVLFLLARLILFAVLFGCVGGFSSIFFLAITKSLRGFNRISVFIACFSILFLCLLIDRLFKQKKAQGISPATRRVITIIVVACMCLGAVEQMNDPLKLNSTWKDENAQYQEFFQQMESEEASGSMIWQLPYQTYPEGAPINNLGSYDHMKGFLFTHTLRFSFGTTAGTEADNWARATANEDVASMVDDVKNAGFAGIYVDANGYAQDDAQELISNLKILVDNDPLIDKKGDLYYFSFNHQ